MFSNILISQYLNFSRAKRGSRPERTEGFTLIEMLVVVTIIAILATAFIVGSTASSREANRTRAQKDIADIRQAIEMARLNTGKSLRAITGATCTECACLTTVNPVSVLTNQSSQCWNNYKSAIQAINNASGGLIDGYPTTPQGYPYLIDENEGENCCGRTPLPNGYVCYRDSIRAYGPDGRIFIHTIGVPTYNCPDSLASDTDIY